MKIIYCRANLFCSILLIFAGCRSRPAVPEMLPAGEINIKIESSAPEPKDDILQTVVKNDVLFFIDKNSPVEILDMTLMKRKFDPADKIVLELKNIGDKDISKVEIGVGPPPYCMSFALNGDTIFKDPKETVITPSGEFSVQIPPEIVRYNLSPEIYKKSCPAKDNKPSVYVWRVTFADGTSWKTR